jgi:hypothetical protein
LIGQKRNTWRDAKKKHGPQEVAEALKDVRWGPGRAVTAEVAEKGLQIYNKFAQVPAIVDIIVGAQNSLGRQSVFEEYSKLLLLCGGGRSSEETVWIMQQMVADQTSGKTDGYSKAELTKKSSPLNVFLLRKKLVDGILEHTTRCHKWLLSKARRQVRRVRSFKSEMVQILQQNAQVGAANCFS